MSIPNRAFNVEKATELINGEVVKPGRTWSFNDTVGDRTEKNGWKLANGIFGGDRYTYQYGGGVCQVSTTLYNAIMQCYTSISIVERRQHSIPSSYVDKGLDATVDTNHIDLRFKNTSEHPLYIFAYVTTNKWATQRKRDLTVLIYGEALPNNESYKLRSEVVSEVAPDDTTIEYIEDRKLFIGEEVVEVEARNEFTVDVYLDKYIDGKLVGSELLYTDVYDGNPKKIRIGTLPTPTPEPTATPTPVATPQAGTDDLP
ncbi:MAG: VanW family protein [Clostridia bacterium]|nr:VanW family protein [Clostridia bacterium]